ncbi:unnamed protein product [Musa acuminata subsp. burmannicoides]
MQEVKQVIEDQGSFDAEKAEIVHLNCLHELKQLTLALASAYLITGLPTASQEKVLHMAKPILEEAIGRVYTSLLPERMAVVDLGCSSGSTTLEVVSEVLDVIGKLRRSLGRQEMPEILFFLNDLPGNDFNHVFRSLGDYKRKVEEEKGNLLVPYYVVGVPGSFYGRLFPSQSVHFFNASSCLNWLSQVPEGEQGVLLNNKNIYVAETSPLEVVKAYQDQRQRDLSEFLRCRHAELSYGARMVLSFVGRKRSYPPWGDMGYLFRPVSRSPECFGVTGNHRGGQTGDLQFAVLCTFHGRSKGSDP